MKFLVLCVVFASAACKPSGLVSYIAPAFAAPVSSQFHAQDVLGQYSYGYSNLLSTKAESRALDGTTIGRYSFVDPNGKVQSVEYTSDAANGFRVAATNLPVAPALPVVPAVPLPVPVQDTPEVVEARAKHLLAVTEARARATVVPLAQAVEVKSLAAPILALAPAVSIAVKSTSAPSPEVKSVASPTVDSKSIATPTVALKSAPTPTVDVKSIVAPTIAVKSFITPAISVGSPAFGYTYSINPHFGYNTLIAAPSFYSSQF